MTRRHQDIFVIDYGINISEVDAALYEMPFAYALENVKPKRDKNKDKNRRNNWWRFGRTGGDLRTALTIHARYIALSFAAKHIFWKWLPSNVMPDKALIVIALSDDTTFGILHSRFHELWSLKLGTSLEDRPRYTPTTFFETFPFPALLTPKGTKNYHAELDSASSDQIAGQARNDSINANTDAISAAANLLNELRENWLNPAEWVDWVITAEEEKANYPKRAVAKAGFETELKKRTLTNLYNLRLSWLDNADKALDLAVANAYGWHDYTPKMLDDEILRRLLKLNLERFALN